MSQDGPVDPLTNLDEVAANLHEFYRSLTASGRFTRAEACMILGAMIATGAGYTDG